MHAASERLKNLRKGGGFFKERYPAMLAPRGVGAVSSATKQTVVATVKQTEPCTKSP